jgi:hypothetical protein
VQGDFENRQLVPGDPPKASAPTRSRLSGTLELLCGCRVGRSAEAAGVPLQLGKSARDGSPNGLVSGRFSQRREGPRKRTWSSFVSHGGRRQSVVGTKKRPSWLNSHQLNLNARPSPLCSGEAHRNIAQASNLLPQCHDICGEGEHAVRGPCVNKIRNGGSMHCCCDGGTGRQNPRMGMEW